MCKKSVEKAIEFIEKSHKQTKAGFIPTCEDGYGITYCTDGYQCLRTLEEIDESHFREGSNVLNACEKIFDEKYLEKCEAYKMPDASELESKIKELKKECRPKRNVSVGYAIADNMFFNAEYLLNALKSTEESVAYSAGRYQPLMFLGADTQYVLLPIRNNGVKAGEFRVKY